MNSAFSAERGSPRPAGKFLRVPAGRRRLSLAEIVRDLAGWTLPAHRPEPTRTPAGWPLA